MSEEVTTMGSEEVSTSAVETNESTLNSAPEETPTVAQPTTIGDLTAGTTQSQTFDFREHLDADLRDNPSLESIKDLNNLAKSYVNAQSLIGKSLRIPGDEATDEQRSDFYNKIGDVPGVAKLPDPANPDEVKAFYGKLGCPEDVSKYELDLPEGADVSDHMGLIEAAHSAGITSSQLQVLANANMKREQAQYEAEVRQTEEGKAFLQETFGEQMSEKIADAKTVLRMYEDKNPQAVADLMNGPAGRNPIVIMALADLGKSLKEVSHSGTESAPSNGMSLKEVQSQIAGLYKDESFMKSLSDPRDPGHQSASQKRDDLYRLQHALTNQ
jgi:hypothetical protein